MKFTAEQIKKLPYRVYFQLGKTQWEGYTDGVGEGTFFKIWIAHSRDAKGEYTYEESLYQYRQKSAIIVIMINEDADTIYKDFR
jgi:hypothetical protein